jgi:putative tryptophan/tyrosine transport system substrate-binding protein
MWGSTLGCIVMLTLSMLAAPLAAEAQRAANLPRIGVLVPAGPSMDDPHIAAFLHALRDLGYVEGQTIAVEYRYGHGVVEHFPALIAELVRLHVHVLVVGSGPATVAAKQATQTLPIVFVGVGDPVGFGLVASLARPGGNLTGLSFALGEGFAGKWVELLREAVPQASRVAFLQDPTALITATHWQEMQHAAQVLGLQLQRLEVRDPHQFDSAFAAMATEGAQALIVDHSAFFHAHHSRIVALTAQHRLPGMYPTRPFVEAGGLMCYGVSIADLWRRAATYVGRILKGAAPADLPVEQPIKFELVINRKTAQTLGLKLSPVFLFLADEVLD